MDLLRRKSWTDLHGLWYALVREQNKLRTERTAAKYYEQAIPTDNGSRDKKVEIGCSQTVEDLEIIPLINHICMRV